MALRKAVNSSLLRQSVSSPTFCRTLTSAADQGLEKDCRREAASGFKYESWAFVKWASGLALVGSLGLLHFSGWKGDAFVADCASNEFADKPSASKKRATGYVLRDSYRQRVFFKYEKRIRMRSSPEKVFEYFASIQGPDGEFLMTPADLMRAVVPVFPPSGSDIIRDGSLRGEQPPGELICSPSKFFMLFDIDEDGLISFPEYIFFVTLLSVPGSDISAAFKMLDLDHDGKIDREEFRKVMNLMRTKHRQGAAHRDGCRTGFKVVESVENGGLLKFFFGKDGSSRLQLEEFKKFIRDLHDEIIRLEFEHYDYQSIGTISAKDFALSMVAAADMKRINQYLDRVDDMSNDPALNNIRITRDEYWSFVKLRRKLRPLALAMYTYGKVYGSLTKADFQRAAEHVCKVEITNNLVDIIFHIFDSSKDGNLSIDEFLGVLDRREWDIAYPRESGIIHLLTCWWDCTKDCHSKWSCS
ncbi:calcium uptake protein, mitochondrial [Cryptomeria japonica]|uniref:calcium uptake protein, mitochondrial n=1 Tax=Cryptomeria japonica TaxID=3369 RepID=UPI0025AC597D|nr:calcium uptake protein, mitochondrial [Cryptomeria japonica]